MNMTAALVLIVIGIVLLAVGLGSGDSIQHAFSRLLGGHIEDPTVWWILGGCACLVVGVIGGFISHSRRR
ncbi:MAG: DUF3185 family protein [Planctomycetes bacterium]|nr:DUF3185 family protein [Planctomycetota bacterium]